MSGAGQLMIEGPRGQRPADAYAPEGALPYVDEYTDEQRLAAERLVTQELRSAPPRRHAMAPAAPFPAYSDALREELPRLARGEPMKPLEATRSVRGAGTREELDEARRESEYLGLRAANADLLAAYGANAWLMHNKTLDAVLQTLRRDAEAARAAVVETNRQRKAEQRQLADQLEALEARWLAGVQKNAEIAEACAKLEHQIAALGASASSH
eukprot:m51a1_g10703 hypothetical protein (213) ;mRNA; f:159374-160318